MINWLISMIDRKNNLDFLPIPPFDIFCKTAKLAYDF